MRVFLDTNILLDVLLQRHRLGVESKAVIDRCSDLRAQIFVAWHGLATAYYFLRKGVTEEEALLNVDHILTWARVAKVGDSEARRARLLNLPDFEDALQTVSAEVCAARWIVTRDKSGFRGSSISVISPAEFLALFPTP